MVASSIKMNTLTRFTVRFGVKSAVLGGAVYYTVQKGVWADSETTAALCEELQEGISPYIGEMKKNIPIEVPPLPATDRIEYLAKHYWNSGVNATFTFLAMLPTHTVNAGAKTYTYLSKSLENASKNDTQLEKAK